MFAILLVICGACSSDPPPQQRGEDTSGSEGEPAEGELGDTERSSDAPPPHEDDIEATGDISAEGGGAACSCRVCPGGCNVATAACSTYTWAARPPLTCAGSKPDFCC